MSHREKEKDGASNDSTTPKAAVGRLSLYLRQLEDFYRLGHETVSSNQLGTALEITDAQVRKDLAYFGQFGSPGIGYRVAALRESLKSVLGTNREWAVCLIGVGNLGRALLGYRGFQERGFHIKALFDRDPHLIGKKYHDLVVTDLAELPVVARSVHLSLAILAVPASSAESVTQTVQAAGITGILNFAPVRLKVAEEVSVVSVDLGLQLEQLSFQVTQRRTLMENGAKS